MKRFARRIMDFTLVMALALMLLPSISAKADVEEALSIEDFGDPISETTYEDEELGCIVTERVYYLPDATTRGASGSGTYRNEKTYTWGSGAESTYYAQGHFSWGNGNVSVTSPSGNISNIPSSCSVSNKKVTSGTGKYGLIFNKYAYVTFSCTATSAVGIDADLSVTIRISESGNVI